MSTANLTIGAFYELPDGGIARTYGWNGTLRTVWFHLDDGFGGHQATEEETATWKPRLDLQDFPEARDPMLPYDFDLSHDIKRRSELVRAFMNEGGDTDLEHLKALMAECGIRFTEAEEAAIAAAGTGPKPR
jgi:hypothetical protein